MAEVGVFIVRLVVQELFWNGFLSSAKIEADVHESSVRTGLRLHVKAFSSKEFPDIHVVVVEVLDPLLDMLEVRCQDVSLYDNRLGHGGRSAFRIGYGKRNLVRSFLCLRNYGILNRARARLAARRLDDPSVCQRVVVRIGGAIQELDTIFLPNWLRRPVEVGHRRTVRLQVEVFRRAPCAPIESVIGANLNIHVDLLGKIGRRSPAAILARSNIRIPEQFAAVAVDSQLIPGLLIAVRVPIIPLEQRTELNQLGRLIRVGAGGHRDLSRWNLIVNGHGFRDLGLGSEGIFDALPNLERAQRAETLLPARPAAA